MRFGSLLVGNIIFRSLNIISNVLVTFLLTRLVSVEGFGIYSLLIANASLFSLLSGAGAESGITFQYSSNGIARRKIFSIIYIILIAQVVLLLLTELLFLFLTGNYWFLSQDNPEALLLGLLYFFSIALTDKYVAFFNGAHLYALCNKIIFFCTLVTLSVFLFFFISGEQADTFFYLKWFIAATFLQAIVLAVLFHSSKRPALRFEKPGLLDWKIFFSYSLVALTTNIIQFFAYRIDFWIIDFYHGKDGLGLYSLAVKIGQLFWALPLLFASIIFAQVASKEKRYGEETLFRLIRISAAILLLMFAFAALLAPWFIPLLAGQVFAQSVRPFLYLLPGLLLFCMNIMLAAYFAGKGRLFVNLIGSILCFTIVLVLDLLLIPRYGIEGAAVASTIAYSVSGIYHIWKFSGFRAEQLRTILVAKRGDWNMMGNYLKNIFR